MSIDKDFVKAEHSNKNEISTKEWVRVNRWLLFLLIFAASIMTVVYIKNVREVNNLVVDVRRYEKEKIDLINENKLLRTQLLKLESPERIIPIAEEKLNMHRPGSSPIIIYQD